MTHNLALVLVVILGIFQDQVNGFTLVQLDKALSSTYSKKMTEAQFQIIEQNYQTAGGITSVQELAMFLSQVFFESAGLHYKEELACMNHPETCKYVDNTGGAPGKYYYGRGYIQLTHARNYKAASLALFGDDRLVLHPELVATDESIAWKTAFWFWKTNVHTHAGVTQGHFDLTTTYVNGAKSTSRTVRFHVYEKVFAALQLPGKPTM